MKRLVALCAVFSLLALVPAVQAQAGGQGQGGFDYTKDKEIPLSAVLGRELVINPCATPPQVIEDWTGTHSMNVKWKFILDENGKKVAIEGHQHMNHQNGGATGYDLVVDADGKIVYVDGKPKKAVDENGNFITTAYEIPGTYNWGQQLNENHQDGDHWSIHEVFMCNLISHGSDGNGLIHFNGHTTFTEGGDVDVYTDNYWCKCAGAGPDKNGPVDCETFMDFCQDPRLEYGPK